MDMASLAQLISSFGFPIVACLAMGWYINDTNNKHREEIKELNKEHSNEISEVRKALENNTVAVEKLCTLISLQQTTE